MIAAARQDRTFLPPPDQCPLDPSAPGRPTEIPADSYDVVVFENRFPSLREPLGRCEVVCFTSAHDASFAELTPAAGAHRVRGLGGPDAGVLSALPETKQVYCFENRGEEIGVTLHHPHGQIYALPVRHPADRSGWWRRRGTTPSTTPAGNLFDDLVAAELQAGTRIVTRNEHWVAFVPEAARWPYEVRIFPAARVPDLTGVSEAAAGRVLRRSTWTCCAGSTRCSTARAVHLRLAPGARSGRIARRQFAAHLAGADGPAGGRQAEVPGRNRIRHGRVTNDIVPEEAAQRLREA